jgi:hypothetical protein
MIKRILLFFSLIFGRSVDDMAMAYAILIINGRKNYSDVPARLKEQVAQILRDLDCEYLIEE